MQIITNESLIKRNARIGQIASLVGLVVLVGGMVLSFQGSEQIGLSFGALLVGFALSQIGIYYGNRYARPPRPDTALDDALKGLDKRYTLFHYNTPVSHLLVGPAGIWVLFPRHQRGTITYEKGRWRQKGGIGLWYLKLFAQEGLGRPDLEIGSSLNQIQNYLEENLPDFELPNPQAALLFTHPDVEVDAEEASVPTMPIKKLKPFIRKEAKENHLSMNKVKAVVDVLKDEEQASEDSQE